MNRLWNLLNQNRVLSFFLFYKFSLFGFCSWFIWKFRLQHSSLSDIRPFLTFSFLDSVCSQLPWVFHFTSCKCKFFFLSFFSVLSIRKKSFFLSRSLSVGTFGLIALLDLLCDLVCVAFELSDTFWIVLFSHSITYYVCCMLHYSAYIIPESIGKPRCVFGTNVFNGVRPTIPIKLSNLDYNQESRMTSLAQHISRHWTVILPGFLRWIGRGKFIKWFRWNFSAAFCCCSACRVVCEWKHNGMRMKKKNEKKIRNN